MYKPPYLVSYVPERCVMAHAFLFLNSFHYNLCVFVYVTTSGCTLLLVPYVRWYGDLKIPYASRISHPSAYCVVIIPYILPPYYTDGTITCGPIVAPSWDHTGPVYGMKHHLQLHLCVFLIHLACISPPHLRPSNPHPLPSSHLPLGKLRASL